MLPVVAGILVVLPTCFVGLVMDDVLVRMRLLDAQTAWGDAPWWDLYTFARPELNADLRDADLQRAQLQRANLGQARLDGADLRQSNLQFTNLRGASLRGADLRGSTLYGTDLRQADLSGARLDDGALEQAYWQGAHGIKDSVRSHAALHNAGVTADRPVQQPRSSPESTTSAHPPPPRPPAPATT